MSAAAAVRDAFQVDAPLSGGDHRRIAHLLGERRTRQCEALRLYRPLPTQDEFHRCRAYIRLLIGGNRGGKSRGAAVEFARAVTGQDPHNKFPKENGKVYVVGKSLKHIGDTIYPILFRAGAFKMLRDEVTGEWRIYRPWEPGDKRRAGEVKQTPPLIPPRFVRSIAWKSKADQEISRVTFVNGWEALFFSAEGRLPQGSDVDLVWLDEEIPDSSDGEWFPEMSARLMDRQGTLMWSATPQAGLDQLYDLYQKAELQEQKYKLDPVANPKPEVVGFQFDLADNPHIETAAKVRFLTNLTADQQLVRGAGDFTISALRVYPEFQLAVHGWAYAGHPPRHWTKYAYVDPGHTICAVLFFACPPPDECPAGKPIVLAYDELYIPQCNAILFGQRMKEKVLDDPIESFWIDVHGAPREAGSGRSIREQYSEALAKNRVSSRLTGYEFFPAPDDRKAGVMAVHEYLAVRSEGGPTFRVQVDPNDPTLPKTPTLCWELRRYRKKKVKGVVIDDPEDRGATHLCQCVRYMAMSEPEWVDQVTAKRTWHDDLFDHVQALTRQRQGALVSGYNLGPGG